MAVIVTLVVFYLALQVWAYTNGRYNVPPFFDPLDELPIVFLVCFPGYLVGRFFRRRHLMKKPRH